MKKILITFFVIFILCFSVNTVFADSFNVVVDNKTANPGDTVEINISLENNSGIIAALFDVEYDKERLELVEVQDAQLLVGGTFSPNYKSYPYKMVWNSASHNNFTNNGVLATLKFRVLDNAKTGKAFVTLTYNENDVFDVDLNNVPVTVINGGIDVVNNSQSSGTGSSGGISSGGSSSTHKPVINESVNNPAKEEQIILTIGKKEAQVFGETKVNDVAPIIKNERTMLPARFVAENLGADVQWDAVERKVIITKKDITIIITIDSQTALVNDKAIVLESPAFIENDRTYTPLRFIAEKLGAKVDWKDQTREVIITKQDEK